ncbi:hypothetical protein ACFOWM_03620 [Ferruginibacter yonginensis]|uniref:Uncharacterized protein n=1 Tax=Ferruginibacter yonginensis TaxID=1310416 RepID=A0ABV8QQH8_9BACT
MHIAHTDKVIFEVPVLNGAPEELVGQREQRSCYFTNRSIKVWSTFFLLKAQTTSGTIQHWINQKQYLLQYLKLRENSFRSHLKELCRLELVKVDKNFNVTLTSFQKAADVLGIHYDGTFTITYDATDGNKQQFQYLLRAEEIRANQFKQLKALVYKLDKNPDTKDWLMHLLKEKGCDPVQLVNDPLYFQVSLLDLQEKAFIYGSDIYEKIQKFRADINRGIARIAEHHNYKGTQSVSYMKKVMLEQGIIKVKDRLIISNKNCKLYIVDAEGKRKEISKWLPSQERSAWRLCSQVYVQTKSSKKMEKHEKKNAEAA